MFLWFIGLGPLLVWVVFRSPALDLRMVILGSLLPLLDGLFGGPRVLHSLTGAVVVLLFVMLSTRRRRLLRRRLLGLPIGLFIHLVLDGAWTDTDTFWWPFSGWTFPSDQLPELARGGWTIVMEIAGGCAIAFAWRLFGLADPARRDRFLRTGRVDVVEDRRAG
ncbi:MAG: hypothetical protein JO291_14980 [Acidimicrobiia bacterium]|nr:hypothetical protein [Acidimicrobiia bacterium]